VLPEAEVIDSGCCGMAGSFGYEADKYDVSMRIGERRLLPKVRAATGDTLIVSDGFSCHGQIETYGRRPLHIAQVLLMALRQQAAEPRASRIAVRRLRTWRNLRRLALLGAAAVALAAVRARAG
jgi:hypothetical protein